MPHFHKPSPSLPSDPQWSLLSVTLPSLTFLHFLLQLLVYWQQLPTSNVTIKIFIYTSIADQRKISCRIFQENINIYFKSQLWQPKPLTTSNKQCSFLGGWKKVKMLQCLFTKILSYAYFLWVFHWSLLYYYICFLFIDIKINLLIRFILLFIYIKLTAGRGSSRHTQPWVHKQTGIGNG